MVSIEQHKSTQFHSRYRASLQSRLWTLTKCRMLSVVLSPDTEKMHHDSSKISLRIQPPGLNDEAMRASLKSIATEQNVDISPYLKPPRRASLQRLLQCIAKEPIVDINPHLKPPRRASLQRLLQCIEPIVDLTLSTKPAWLQSITTAHRASLEYIATEQTVDLTYYRQKPHCYRASLQRIEHRYSALLQSSLWTLPTIA